MTKASLLLRRRRGSVTVLAATMFPVLVGMAGLTTEYGTALLTKVKMQRIADAAAYSGALAYNAVGTTDALNQAVSRIATLNGIPTTDLAASVASSPTGDGSNAVVVTATSNVALGLSQLIRGGGNVTVSASAYAEMKAAANGVPCIIALNTTGTGVMLSGAGAIIANACAVSTNNTITVPNGASVTTPVVTYDSASAPSSATLSNIHAPAGVSSVSVSRKLVSDPLASNLAISLAYTHLASVGLLSNPSIPTIPASTTDISLTWSPGSWSGGGCTALLSGSTWTLTCSGTGPFNFRSLSMGGGLALNFNTGGSSSATYNFSGSVNTGGNPVTFGPGTYNIAQGLITGSCSNCTVTFKSPGTYNVANYNSGTTTCTTGSYSINSSSKTVIFNGPSRFVLPCGIWDQGGEALTLGSGSSSNSYTIGSSSTGYAINMGGGSFVTLNDATGAGNVFQANGSISNGGGSCLALPAATAQDINGSIILGGGATLGSGVYTIDNYLGLGTGGGGTVTCNGQSLGLAASGVTLVVGGNSTVSCGSSSVAICIEGGYNNVTLTAPSTGTTARLAIVGPPSTSGNPSAGAVLTAGATGTSVSGVFYVPRGEFSMAGAANIGNGTGQCLELIASQVTISNGAAAGTTCSGLGGTSVAPPTIALVQ